MAAVAYAAAAPLLFLFAANAARPSLDDVSIATSSSQCPPGSEVFTLSTESRPTRREFTNVVLADYPSTGSSWLRVLLEKVSVSDGATTCGAPGCSIYKGEWESPCESNNAHCPCSWSPASGARLVKDHYPALDLWQNASLNSRVYEKTMDFDKVIHLLRHPVPTVTSNVRRFSGTPASQSETLRCWGKWWERVKATAGSDKVHVLRYEDLCRDTVVEVEKVLQFLGGCYSGISASSIQKTIQDNPDLECIHKDELFDMAAGLHAETIINEVGDLMDIWGYNDPASWKLLGRSHMEAASRLPKHLSPGRNFSGLSNPWTAGWGV